MDDLHPTYPHWYLPWLAVDPARQGHGLGAARSWRNASPELDADGMPAYLETPNPRTVPFYERHGFEVTGEAAAGSCPPVTSDAASGGVRVSIGVIARALTDGPH